ncbi:MAG: phytanoyl-CoA dioxygenase family protein [Lentisphaerae bacterium]|nr:phytanoyl-CoA dioxygenase family protein [Lentisphaerota bacterium]
MPALIQATQCEQFREQGYFVTEPMWSSSALDRVRAEFERLHGEHIRRAEASGDAIQIDLARTRPFIGQAHTRSEVLKDFARSPIYLEACAHFVGPDADLYYNQVVSKPPEHGKHFGWHQDSGYMVTKPLAYITCWTAISRTFVENGCIWVIPGSHKRGLLPHARNQVDQSWDAQNVDESGAIPVPMEPGQVAIFSSLMLHKSGANVSRDVRHGYVPQYHVPGIVEQATGKRFGDQFPVLRGGLPV